MTLRKPLSKKEWQTLLDRIHRALICGDDALVGKILANYGLQLSDAEMASLFKGLGGTWKEVA